MRGPPPAPGAAPLRPPSAAPAAAPIAVPTTALFAALSAAISEGEVPPICTSANWRHSTSSKRSWSKLFPVPGSTMTLGPLGMLTHATSSSDAAKTVETRRRLMAGSAPGRRLRRHALPAPGTFLDVRIVGLGLAAIAPIGGGLRRRRLRGTLLDVRLRRAR